MSAEMQPDRSQPAPHTQRDDRAGRRVGSDRQTWLREPLTAARVGDLIAPRARRRAKLAKPVGHGDP